MTPAFCCGHKMGSYYFHKDLDSTSKVLETSFFLHTTCHKKLDSKMTNIDKSVLIWNLWSIICILTPQYL